MSEAIVSAILEQLTTVLDKEVIQEVKLVTGVKKEIKKLKSNFESIRALLDDAGEKQFKEKSIKLWLDRLKEVCYDMEDVLDEWRTALLKLQIDEADRNSASHSKGKVCSPLIPCFSFGHQVFHRRGIALKIKKINERLDDIAREKGMYQLKSRDFNRRTRRVVESTTFVDVSRLRGRDAVKNDVVNSLLCGDGAEVESKVKTISVVGMGGMGKTALAQLIYKDCDVETHFDKRIWVCVSEDFDLARVAKAILGNLGLESAENIASDGLQNLFERICQSVKSKKVFLVLDDVWADEGEDWGSLKQAFADAVLGSRILVTTRKVTVAKAMESFCVFSLEELSHEACWEVLSQEAFVGRGEEQRKNLEDIGKEIAKKCRGLPLGAKTLGGMLRSKQTRGEWENVLNSELWKMNLVHEKVFAPLMLSYYDLPSAIRRCFLYCSVFPKDHEIDRERLINEWMAQGYLNSIENPEMEETGDEYFECLAARSFFQDFNKEEDGSVYSCKMHDMVVDFARFLMGNEARNLKECNASSRSVENVSWEKIRHLFVELRSISRPPTIVGAEKLRSFAIFGPSIVCQYSRSLCIQQKHLRSMGFSNGFVFDLFPKEVGKLVHLRLLSLYNISKLKELPEAVCDLCNLQSLYLQNCNYLEKLPTDMEKLINLRCLDTTSCFVLKPYPKGIRKLTSLRKLRGVVLRCDRNDDEVFSLGDFENLCHLRFLSVELLVGDNIDVAEAKRARLHSKIHLRELTIFIPSTMDRDNVIQVLNPASHTKVIVSDDELYFKHAKSVARIKQKQTRLERQIMT